MKIIITKNVESLLRDHAEYIAKLLKECIGEYNHTWENTQVVIQARPMDGYCGFQADRRNSYHIYLNEKMNMLGLVSTLAHEFRHVYQAIVEPEIFDGYSLDTDVYDTHPAEVDANAFEDWYINVACERRGA